jgi:hypothetical protein
MPTISLKAHFDGQSIQLDEPFAIPANTKLLVTLLTPSSVNEENDDWSALSLQSLGRAYGDNEPDYSEADIKP